MARFVHLTDARLAKDIRRRGLRPQKRHSCLFCVPMTSDPSQAFQWGRELRRRGYRQTIAVVFVVPDDEPVTVGRYGEAGDRVTAAEAIARFRFAPAALGLEIRIPRSIAPSELKGIRSVPGVAGWRYYPEAKHSRPFWALPGDRNAARLRRAINKALDKEDRELGGGVMDFDFDSALYATEEGAERGDTVPHAPA